MPSGERHVRSPPLLQNSISRRQSCAWRQARRIPFSSFHLGVILVLGFVALVDGYDGSMTGTLLVLAKKPLHITPGEIRLLAVASSLAACVGGFVAAAISDHWSRRTVMLLGVAAINFFTLLIPLAQSGEHLIIIRLLTGLAIGFAASAPFPIAAELMPAQHRRTFGAIYERCWPVRSPWCRWSALWLPATRMVSGSWLCRPFLGCSSCRCWCFC